MQRLLTRASIDDPGFADYERRQNANSWFEGWKLWHLFVVLLAMFPYIAIPILFVMVSQIKDQPTVYEGYVSAQLSVSSSVAATQGAVVSLSSSGAVQLGAGTSIYRNSVADFTSAVNNVCPSYLDVDALFENHYLVSFYDTSSALAYLRVVALDSSAPSSGGGSSTVFSMTSTYVFYQFVTLDAESGLFVGICQDLSSTQETGFIVAGQVQNGVVTGIYDIILTSNPVQYADSFSVQPAITRLSPASFAITYYANDVNPPYQNMLTTRYGIVDPSTLQTTLYDSIPYADNANYTLQATVVGLSSTQYLLMYYSSAGESDAASGGPLTTILASVSLSVVGSVSLGNATELAGASKPAFYLAATAVSNSSAVVAFSDPSTDFGISAVVVSVIESVTTSEYFYGESSAVVYGSKWEVTRGQAMVQLPDLLFMDLDISALSSDAAAQSGIGEQGADIILLYSDVSNSGALTATMGQITNAGELLRASPDFIIGEVESADGKGMYAWGALAAGAASTPLNVQAAIVTAQTPSSCSGTSSNNAATIMFSTLEMLPSPAGVISAIKTSSSSSSSTLPLTSSVSTPDPAATISSEGVVSAGVSDVQRARITTTSTSTMAATKTLAGSEKEGDVSLQSNSLRGDGFEGFRFTDRSEQIFKRRRLSAKTSILPPSLFSSSISSYFSPGFSYVHRLLGGGGDSALSAGVALLSGSDPTTGEVSNSDSDSINNSDGGSAAANGGSIAVASNSIIALAGSLPNQSGLVAGRVYYTNTVGKLFTVSSSSSTLLGRASSASDAGNYYYVYDPDTDTIVTLNSQVGVATSANLLFLLIGQ